MRTTEKFLTDFQPANQLDKGFADDLLQADAPKAIFLVEFQQANKKKKTDEKIPNESSIRMLDQEKNFTQKL